MKLKHVKIDKDLYVKLREDNWSIMLVKVKKITGEIEYTGTRKTKLVQSYGFTDLNYPLIQAITILEPVTGGSIETRCISQEYYLLLPIHEAEGKKPDPAPCHWRQDVYGEWIADCNPWPKTFLGTPSESGIKYCQNCGNPVCEHEWKERK